MVDTMFAATGEAQAEAAGGGQCDATGVAPSVSRFKNTFLKRFLRRLGSHDASPMQYFENFCGRR
ncbi:MAG: hypothetical protein AB8G14_16710, partial [Ilumatobacter sp.]